MIKLSDVFVVGELNADMILSGINIFPSLGKKVFTRDWRLFQDSNSAFLTIFSVLRNALNQACWQVQQTQLNQGGAAAFKDFRSFQLCARDTLNFQAL